MRSSFASTVAAATLLSHLVGAQQYAGEVIPNSLPKLNNAAISFWNMKVTKTKNATLINYMSAPGNKRQDPTNVQRAVILLHGLQRDPYNYWGSAYGGLQGAKKINPAINDNTVALIAPYFANGADKNVGYPWIDDQPAGQGSNTSALVWQASRWASGDDSQYPHKTDISSYKIIDNIIKYFNDASIYPNLKHIVIAGHSLGGQFVQRYALVGDQLGTAIPMTYWAGDPNSFAWLNSSRPINPAPTCTEYDDWRNGLSNYDVKYGAALVAQGSQAVEANFRTRRFIFARGLNDFGNDNSDCPPNSQGANRGTRFYNFLNFFRPAPPQMVDYFPNVGHDAPTIYNSRAGIQRFYLDNWDGSGNYAPDQGPRMLDFDDPYPDPDYVSKWGNYTGARGTIDIPKPLPVIVKDSVTINAQVNNATLNMGYAGCYTDSGSARSLPKLISSTNVTTGSCVGACANANYTVAGIEFGTECYCGQQLANNATLVGDSDCSSLNQGNKTQYGGGSFRLSVYNSGTLTFYTGPHLVPTAGPYNSIGCWTDTGGARTLSGKTVSKADTVEKCATACTGFNFFGVEFGVECYCGNTMNAASKPANLSSCSMPCGGNSSETCGNGNFLNMYQLNGTTLPVSTTSTSSSTTSVSTTKTSTSITSTTTSTTSTSTSSTSTTSTPATSASTTATITSDSATTSPTTSTTATSSTSSSTSTQGLTYAGCWTDASSRTLGRFVAGTDDMTPKVCSSMCTAVGLAYAGIEFGRECYCGSSLKAGTLAPDSDCNMPCAGDKTAKCGASWRLSVYTVASA